MPTTICTRRRTRSRGTFPSKYKHAIDYVEVRGRTKIVVRGTISEYIPNPTFDVSRAPARRRSTSTSTATREGKSMRELIGRADAVHPGVP